MKYIIDGCIGFCADDGSLYRIDSNDSIILPVPAQRLLLILLDSNGEILSRDELLVMVWDNYGLTGSGNALNQYLSLLRRSISAFGCDTFVETIPKVGIRLHKTVHCEKQTSTPVVSDKQPKADVKSGARNLRLHHGALHVITAFLISMFMVIMFTDRHPWDPTTFINDLPGGCKFVTFFKPNDSILMRRTEDAFSSLQKMAGKECKQDVTFYFDNISSQGNVDHARTLMAYCENDDRGNDVVCDNFYSLSGSAEGEGHEK